MIKILIAAHGDLGEEYQKTVELIAGKKENICVVKVDAKTSMESIKEMIKNSVDENAGTLVITDMFGGTPSNLSLPYLSEGKVEIVFGLNLPMLLTAVTKRDKLKLPELAESVSKSGKDSVFRAIDLLKNKK